METFKKNRIQPMALVMFFALTLLFSCSGSDNSSTHQGSTSGLPELEQIQQEINTTGKKWTAGHTELSELSYEDRQYYYGALEPEGDMGEEVYVAKDRAAVASSYDWRNVNGNSYVTPVKNQGWNYLTGEKAHCGSCWAFASTAALESQVQIQSKSPGSYINLSEQIVLSCSGAGTCKGGNSFQAATFMKNTGLLGSYCFTYQAQDLSCTEACPDWFQHNVERSSFKNVYAIKGDTTQSTCNGNTKCAAIKSALATTGPVVVMFYVCTDFIHYKGGVYSRIPSATSDGAHFVLVVGYNDDGQYFIVKNSWGTDWGESGYFRIAYDMMSDPVVKFGVYAFGFNQPSSSSSTN